MDQTPLRALPSPIQVRRALATDGAALESLVDRCSPETVYRRFHAGLGPMARREMRRLLRPETGLVTWVAEAAGDLRGTASLGWSSDGGAEAAFLVEDEWFRHGIGRALFRAIAEHARGNGTGTVVANIHADNDRVRRFLLAVAPHATSTFEGAGEVRIEIPVLPSEAVRQPIRRVS